MSRYVDADKLLIRFMDYLCHDFACSDCKARYYPSGICRVDKMLREFPTSNVVEVVRCKDCMHSEIDKYAPAECQNRCKLSQQYHEPTFFCKCGEPRTDLLEWIHRGDDDEQSV